jgi:predicted Zn-dependent protease
LRQKFANIFTTLTGYHRRCLTPKHPPATAGGSDPYFQTSALLICAALLVFSAVRGTSLMYLQTALTAKEDADREIYFQKAFALDADEPLFRYYYGVHLFNAKQSKEAVPHLRFAVDRGIATSIAFFNLASAQILARQTDEAEKTLAEAVAVYPRSVFLRTAYADFLAENNFSDEAEKQYAAAAEINPEQARSWRLAFSEGMGKLSQTEFADKSYVKTMDLLPNDGIYALLDFQRQFRPNLVRR